MFSQAPKHTPGPEALAKEAETVARFTAARRTEKGFGFSLASNNSRLFRRTFVDGNELLARKQREAILRGRTS
jgi:hypothetical protein